MLINLLTLGVLVAILCVLVVKQKALLSTEPIRLIVSFSDNKEQEFGNIPSIIEIPQEVKDFANLESESWAKAAVLIKAKKYYEELKDWKRVLLRLQNEDTN